MLRDVFIPDTGLAPVPKEGDLYKEIRIAGKIFTVYYGYYEDFEREHHEPMPIYPDFTQDPVYTEMGKPIVTAMQDACSHYKGSPGGEICHECVYFQQAEDLFGSCTCPENRPPNNKSNGNL